MVDAFRDASDAEIQQAIEDARAASRPGVDRMARMWAAPGCFDPVTR